MQYLRPTLVMLLGDESRPVVEALVANSGSTLEQVGRGGQLHTCITPLHQQPLKCWSGSN